jgi:hypothetical protein
MHDRSDPACAAMKYVVLPSVTLDSATEGGRLHTPKSLTTPLRLDHGLAPAADRINGRGSSISTFQVLVGPGCVAAAKRSPVMARDFSLRSNYHSVLKEHLPMWLRFQLRHENGGSHLDYFYTGPTGIIAKIRSTYHSRYLSEEFFFRGFTNVTLDMGALRPRTRFSSTVGLRETRNLSACSNVSPR